MQIIKKLILQQMNNIESNGSFFPSVKAKKINKTHSHKTMNEDFEDKSIYASNNSQSEIKDLIKGYYHGFFKHKKKIKPITVSISVGQSQKKGKQRTLKNENKKGLQGSLKRRIKNKSFSSKKLQISKTLELLHQGRTEGTSYMNSLSSQVQKMKDKKLKINGRMLKHKMKTQNCELQKYRDYNFESNSILTYHSKIQKMKSYLKQKSFSKVKETKTKKDISFRVSPWERDSDNQQNI